MFQAPLSTEVKRIRRVALGDQLHRTAARVGGRLAVVDGPRRVSYWELDAQSNQFAHYLIDCFPEGTHVATLCENSVDVLIGINGIHKSGNVWVPVNVMLDGAQIKYILTHAEVGMLVVDEDIALQPKIAAVLEDLNLPTLVARTRTDQSTLGQPLSMAILGRPTTLPEANVDSDQVAFIMYTSGTTGHPKGVMHSHASVNAGVIANMNTLALTENDVVSCLLPLFHVAQHCIGAAVLARGATLVLGRGFVPYDVLGMICRERLTIFCGLPMMYAALLADPSMASREFSSLRLCVYGMAPMSRSLLGAIEERFAPRILLMTGQTEMYPVTMTFQPLMHPDLDANYWGVSTPLCETAIMDESGKLLVAGEIGEIVHRGQSAMLGYFKDPDSTEVAQRYGWHHTGDLGLIDETGQLRFMDRKKDMIKSGGENVASIKVETTLLGHPAVAAVAVVGLPHAHWSEAVAAFVVKKPDLECSVEDLTNYCRERLGKFEVPKAVCFLDSLPSTATGKMQKHLLRDRYRNLFMSEGK